MTNELTKSEAASLKSCEAIISKGLATFREVGRALARIRDEALYKADYGTFVEYCKDKWNFGRSHAYRLIEAADVPETSPTGDKIETERQAREYLDEQKQEARTDATSTEDSDTDVFDDSADADQEPQQAEPVRVDRAAEMNRIGWIVWRAQDAKKQVRDEYKDTFGDDADELHWRMGWDQFKAIDSEP